MTKNHFFMSLFWTLFDHLFTKITYFSLALKTQTWTKRGPKKWPKSVTKVLRFDPSKKVVKMSKKTRFFSRKNRKFDFSLIEKAGRFFPFFSKNFSLGHFWHPKNTPFWTLFSDLIFGLPEMCHSRSDVLPISKKPPKKGSKKWPWPSGSYLRLGPKKWPKRVQNDLFRSFWPIFWVTFLEVLVVTLDGTS